MDINYNIIEIANSQITEMKLKKIINKKLYNIIRLLEFNVKML